MIDQRLLTHKEELVNYWMKINMNKKRIEPLVHTKQELKEYFYEIMNKGEYLYIDKDIAFSYAFFELNERIKNELKIIFEKMNYVFTYIYDDSQIDTLLFHSENKNCFFRHNNKNLNSETFTFEGVAKLDTEYLAKGEIFSVMDVVDKFANDVLNIPLVYGKDLYKEEYRWYAMLPNNEMLKVGEISYDFSSSHIIKFSLDFSLFIASILMNSDEKGIVLPTRVSPIDIVVLPKNKAKVGTLDLCKKICNELKDYKVLLDDSEDNFGYKNAYYDFKGIPFKVIASISEGEEKIVLVTRYNHEKIELGLEELKKYIYIKSIRISKEILKLNRKRVDEKTELIREGNLDKNKINIVTWCGEECINIDTDYDYLIPFHQMLSSVPCHFCGKLNKKFIYIIKKTKIF